MRRIHILAALRCCAILVVAASLAACGDEEPRAIIISRPVANSTLVATANTPGVAVAPNLEATMLPTTSIATPRPIATPTLSPQIAEYEATVKYWYASYELIGDILIKYNRYAKAVSAYSTFDAYKEHKADIIPLADDFNATVDASLAKLTALTPPPPALAYHSAALVYWQEERASISDLRQAIDHDDIDLWNRASDADRQEKIDGLNKTYQAEQAKLVNDYINKGVKK